MPSPVIRANRAEVSDRFPLLGFTVRTGSNPFFEVVVTTDPLLLARETREKRTADTFWSSRGMGPLPAERGEAVVIVPDDVLRRFVGASRLYYVAATFADRSRANPNLPDITPTLVPSIAISTEYTGRRVRQLVGATAPATRWNRSGNGYSDTDEASLEWAGDAAQPGVESIAPPAENRASAPGNGGRAAPETSTASALGAFEYDDGFGTDLWREREARPSRSSRSRAVADESADVKWADVPVVAPAGDMSCWAASAAMIVAWRDNQSVDPAAITAGVGYWERYRDGLSPADVGHLAAVFDLAAEPPQTYTVDGFRRLVESSGPLWVASAVPGVHAVVVTGIRGSGSPDDTYVSINDPWGRPSAPLDSPVDRNPTPGSGSQYELTYTALMAEYESLGGEAGIGIQVLHTKPEHMRGRRPMATAQAYGTRSQAPTARRPVARARSQAAPAVVPIASAIVGATMSRILSNEGDVSWELDQMRGLKHPNDDPARQGQANFTTTTTRVEGWPKIENGYTDEISADFEIRWQHNGHSLGNVDITPIRSNDAVGWGLEVKATINNDAHVYDGDVAALFIQFKYRFTRSIGSDSLAVTDIILKADGRAEFTRQEWTQADPFSLGTNGAPARAQSELVTAIASPIVNTVLEIITKSLGDDITTDLPRLKGWKYVHDDAANGQRANARTVTTTITGPTVVNRVPEFLGDTMGCDLVITWAYDGRSVGEIQVRPANPRDTAAWSLHVTGEVYDDQQTYQPAGGPSCCAVRLLFNYNFSWTFGSGRANNFDVILYGNGAVAVRNQ